MTMLIETDFVRPRRTKIVATLGPATAERDKLRDLLAAGVNVCRLNFSHGTHADHERMLNMVREVSQELGQYTAVLGDLCGPKIRLNEVPKGMVLETGEELRFIRGAAPAVKGALTISYPHFVDEVRIGDRIYIDDGLVRLLVVDRTEDAIHCRCTVGGAISTRKGVNLPDTPLSISALTEKDRTDLHWAVKHHLDYIALSFARKPHDVIELRQILKASDSDLPIIVKIEKSEAIKHLDEFIAISDGIMVARGDLGVEMDIWQVPLMQKDMARKARDANKPCIVATQMLQSMVANPMPTRAEVSDVANAIFDEVDAVMLSAESASGEYPVESVEMMDRIVRTTEAYLDRSPRPEYSSIWAAENAIASTVALGAVRMAERIQASAVAVWSTSGATARMVSQHRMHIPVVGLTRSEAVCRRLNLVYGIIPVQVEPVAHPGRMAEMVDAIVISKHLAKADDRIVVVSSTKPTVVGTTDMTLVHRVRETSG